MDAKLQLQSPNVRRLPVDYVHQEQRLWCWAACMRMVIAFVKGDSVDQCSLATAAFGIDQCCTAPLPDGCDSSLKISLVSREYERYGLKSLVENRALSFEEIKNEIDAGRPIEVGLVYKIGGHAVLIIGYDEVGGESLVVVADPAEDGGIRSISYSDLSTGAARWINTWLKLRSEG